MRKKILFILLLSLLVGSLAEAQKKKKPRSSSAAKKAVSKPLPVTPAPATAPIIGSTVNILTKGGDKLSGELLELNAFSLRLRTNNLDSAIPLESITAISFGGSKSLESPPPQTVSEHFIRDGNAMITVFQTMANETKTGSDYTEYGRQLSELRRAADRFIQKYSASGNATETRVVALFSGAITDYTWARTIWTLKLGSNGTLSESDAPVIADTLALYPELRTATANGERFNADKLVGSLWKKATEKTERARTLLNPR